MSALFKFVSRLLLVLVILLVIIVIAVPVFFDPNDYKPQIVSQVKQATGRDLVIGGDLGLSFFPWLGLETGSLTLGNAEGFGEQPFATVASAEISVKVLPLLKGRVETGIITLEGVLLNLARDAGGRANWEDLASSSAADAATQPGTTVGNDSGAESGAGAGKPLEINIGGVVVEDATLRWSDAASGQVLSFDNIDLSTGPVRAGQPVDMHLNMVVDSSAPKIQGDLVMDVSALADAGRVVLSGMKLALRLNGDGIPNGELAVDLQASAVLDSAAEVFEMQPMKLVIDQSKMDGSLKVQGFGKPAIAFVLEIDQIDLDSYLSTAAGEASVANEASAGRADPVVSEVTGAGTGAGAAAPGEASSGLPLDTLRELNLDGSLNIGKLKLNGLRLQDVLVNLAAKDGVISLSPAKLALYGGTFAGDVGLDARGESLKTTLKWRLAGVQLGPLLTDMNGEESLSGTANLDADLSLRGNDAEAMKNSVGGSASMRLTDGAYQGIDLLHEVRVAKALLKGKTLPPPGRVATDFAVLSASFRLKNGVVSNNDLKAKSPILRIGGAGRIDLPRETLDYGLDVTITGTLEGQGGKELEQLKGVQIPITLTGSLSDPKVGVSVEKLLKGEVEKRLKGELDKKLGGLLGTGGGSNDGGGSDSGSGTSSDSATDSLKKAIPGALKGFFN